MSFLKKSFIAITLSLSTFGALPLLTSKSANAQNCPSSPAADGLLNKEAFGSSGTYNGFCSGTPSVYGITVYKMGFCTANPIAGGAGVAADYSSCEMTYLNSAGTSASFAAGSTFALPSSGTSFPSLGSYEYAIIELEPSFNIQDSFGPFGDGTTYYSTAGTTSTGSVTSTTSPAATFTHIMNTFGDGTTGCDAEDDVPITGATLTGALLNSSNELIADDTSVSACSGVARLLGVAQLSTPVAITESTTGLAATFTVTNNGSSIYCDGTGTAGCDNIVISSGPFSVSFAVVE